ncbi:FtsX-like permease family protein [Streptacidiphilus carbonis]|uniref:FtsX-like permease family protein n=1 Tax=Streptacidiphilus carbonis TaxID=105422 RepID=UPI0005A773D7|nr:ABC transporter permease [Streptacidiphilus carbonis]
MGGFVLHRLRAHRLLLTAALVTVLLATSVLAALAGFTGSVGDAGVRRTLQTTDAADTPLLFQRSLAQRQDAASDAQVRGFATEAFPGMSFSVTSLALSDPFGLPLVGSAPERAGAAGALSDQADLAHLGTPDRSRLRLVSGAWPRAAAPGGTVQIAVPRSAAARFGVTASGVRPLLTLVDRLTGTPLRVLVTGVYLPKDADDPYWQLDPLGGKGTGTTAGTTGYGPVLIDPGSFSGGAVVQYQVAWAATPDVGALTAARLGAQAAAVRATLARVAAASSVTGGSFTASSRFPAVLDQLQRSVLVARSTLLVAVLQLALLSLLVLLLVARMLAEAHRGENELLRSRGAAGPMITRFAAAEAGLVVLPAAVFAPMMAGPLIRVIGAHGPTGSAGLALSGSLPTSVWWMSLAGALGGAVLILGPALAGTRQVAERRRRGRRPRLAGFLRGGADFALVALAVAAYLQLRGAGAGALSTDSGGTLGVDPVPVAAPALALCAGTVLTLRLLPLVTRVLERWTVRLRSLPAALAGWQLSRRPNQSTGPVLVLALSAAIGTLAIGQSATWQQAQRDQAAFATGGDVRVAASDTLAFGQGGLYSGLPGVDSAVPVARDSVTLGDGRVAALLALDSRAEADSFPLRPDLAKQGAAQLLGALPDPAEAVAAQGDGIVLPGRPTRLTLQVSARLTAGGGAVPKMDRATDTFSVQVTDRYGIPFTLPAAVVPTDGHDHAVTLDLAAAAGDGTPAYPLTVSKLVLTTPVSMDGAVRQDFAVHAISVGSGSVSWRTSAWAAAFDPGRISDLEFYPSEATYHDGRLLAGADTAEGPLAAALDSGTIDQASSAGIVPLATVIFRPRAAAGLGVLPGIADRAFLSAAGAHVGDVVPLDSGAGSMRVRIVASVSVLPGTGPTVGQADGTGSSGSGGGSNGGTVTGGALLVDLAAYDRRADAAKVAPLQPGEWWLNTAAGGGADQRVADAVRAHPGVQTVVVRSQVQAELLRNPLGAGPQGALLAAMALGVALSALGLGAEVLGAVRRREAESAVLRALGASKRMVVRGTAVVLGLPVLVGVGIGAVLGELLTRLVVPLLVLTPEGTVPVPEVRVIVPAGTLGLLLVAVAAVPMLLAALSGRWTGDPARLMHGMEED